ncbi:MULTISPECIES: hypothetical protein [Giesbergeria]|uniref:Uncharacterized protein n=1 Tax=Giesbergeria sinuosa TaxID=80883 RepID=A0ABV9QBU6_9BURK
MSTWSDFYPDLLVHLPACPLPTADFALRRAAQEFLSRTRLWREWLDAVRVVNNVREYDLEVPTGATVVRIEQCTVNGQPMPVLSHNGLPFNYQEAAAPVAGIVSRDRETFHLTRPLPAGSLVATEVSLMPSHSSKGIPNDLFAQHAEDIVAGAKHRLFLIPAFLNGDLSMSAKAVFEAAIAAKTVVAWRGATGSVPRVRARFC